MRKVGNLKIISYQIEFIEFQDGFYWISTWNSILQFLGRKVLILRMWFVKYKYIPPPTL